MRTWLVAFALLATVYAARAETSADTEFAAIVKEVQSALEKRLRIVFEKPEMTVRLSVIPQDAEAPHMRVFGIYDPERAMFRIDKTFATCTQKRLAKKVIADFLEIDEDAICNSIRFRREIGHELGHHYTAPFIREAAPAGWLTPFQKMEQKTEETIPFLLNRLASLMVLEGVGEYFGESLGKPRKPESSDMFDNNHSIYDVQSMQYFLFYDGGYALVRPILDIDVQRGISCLVRNKLAFKMTDGKLDFRPAIPYQKRMIVCASRRK